MRKWAPLGYEYYEYWEYYTAGIFAPCAISSGGVSKRNACGPAALAAGAVFIVFTVSIDCPGSSAGLPKYPTPWPGSSFQ